MDIQLVERLAAAGVSLEGAQELVPVGGPEWVMIGKVVDLTEQLIGIEVKGEWPEEIRKEDFERKVVPPTSDDVAIPREVYRAWRSLFDKARIVCDGKIGTVADLDLLRAALAAIPADMRP